MPGGDRSLIEELIAEDYRQRNREVPDGRASFAALVGQEDDPLVYQRIHRVTAEGCFVAVLSEATWEGAPYAQADLFHVEDGRIAEHWDAAKPIARQSSGPTAASSEPCGGGRWAQPRGAPARSA